MSQPSHSGARRGVSGALQRVAAVTAGDWMAAGIAVAVAVWLGGYAIAGFPTWMATALEVVAAATTLVMVFVIQHTQRRLEVATQLKLDELIHASDADDDIAAIEAADDDELERRRNRRTPASRGASRTS